MTISNILRLLLARRLLITGLAIFGVLLAALYLYLTVPIFQSTATVVLDVRAPETVGQQSVVDQLSSDYLLTQEDILKSKRVARQVVDEKGLAQSPGLAQAYGWTPKDGSVAEYLADNLQYQLEVGSGVVNSRVISISFSSSDSEFAASMANAFADAYADVTLQLQDQPARKTVDSYTKQMQALSAQLEASQAKLAAKEKSLAIVASKGESDADTVRLDALSSQLAVVQAQNAMAQSRTGGQSLPDTLANPVVAGLQSQIAQLEGQRLQMAQANGPNHPAYLQLTNQINGLRTELAKQEGIIRRSTAASSAQAGATVAQLRSAVAAQRGVVIESRAAKNEVAVLEQDVNNLKMLYDQMAARKAQLKVLGDTAQTNVSILSRAVPSAKPVSPRRTLSIVLGLIGGLTLGIIIAVLLELMDRRLRQSEDLERWLGIRDLGSISHGGGKRMQLPRPIAGLLPGS
ncbi:hypothetical protein KFK14_22340 [Sphingobium phenoxybenzoativorans]|uniref:Chain length determinant protein EpsF n=1 Tax=Sphingobium phenoxybenzoativorans TaxID=1592790 RepID=A0A975K707_9SPHN|nr:GNVR domain-containing protein [Sphingobium phenoxybenzoativorans]QUT05657.1 hypothetical protein KFK14_22340 [Sphingobium phenoxybenzoativorans]